MKIDLIKMSYQIGIDRSWLGYGNLSNILTSVNMATQKPIVDGIQITPKSMK